MDLSPEVIVAVATAIAAAIIGAVKAGHSVGKRTDSKRPPKPRQPQPSGVDAGETRAELLARADAAPMTAVEVAAVVTASIQPLADSLARLEAKHDHAVAEAERRDAAAAKRIDTLPCRPNGGDESCPKGPYTREVVQ